MKTLKKTLAFALTVTVLLSLFVFSATAEEPADPSSKLLAEYTFNNENVKDTVGINHAIFYDNKAVSDPVFTDGVVGRGLQLSTKSTGQRYWLSVPYEVFDSNQDSFSISLWYCASSYNKMGEDSELFSFYNSTTEAFMFYSPAATGFQDKAYAMKWNGVNKSYGYANIITPYKENEWVHLVYTVRAEDNMSFIKAYINGVPVEVDQGGDWENSLMSQLGINNFTIGGKNPYKGGDVPMCLFYGAIDEVQIYAGALSAEEAAYLYDTQLNAPDPEPQPEPTEPEATKPEPTESKPTEPQGTTQHQNTTKPQGTTKPIGDNNQTEEGGCFGTISGVAAVIGLMGAALVITKKKKN